VKEGQKVCCLADEAGSECDELNLQLKDEHERRGTREREESAAAAVTSCCNVQQVSGTTSNDEVVARDFERNKGIQSSNPPVTPNSFIRYSGDQKVLLTASCRKKRGPTGF